MVDCVAKAIPNANEKKEGAEIKLFSNGCPTAHVQHAEKVEHGHKMHIQIDGHSLMHGLGNIGSFLKCQVELCSLTEDSECYHDKVIVSVV